MYMNLKPNKHKIISFNTTTMTSLGFIAPPPLKFLVSLEFNSPQKLIFCSGPPPNYFGLKFLGPLLKLGDSKKLIHLLNVTGKILTCQNLNLISSGWNAKFFM